MTVKKALQLVEWLLQSNTKLCKGLLSSEVSWNKDRNENIIKNMAVGITELTKRDSKVLRAIRKELTGDSKHSKID